MCDKSTRNLLSPVVCREYYNTARVLVYISTNHLQRNNMHLNKTYYIKVKNVIWKHIMDSQEFQVNILSSNNTSNLVIKQR